MSHPHVHGPGEHHHHHHGLSQAHIHGGRVNDASRDADHATPMRRLRAALAVTAVFLVIEVVGGLLANSLALLADAGHMLTDVAALALSLFVAWFSRQPASPQRTYGYLRWEVLAAFLNGATLLLISVWIVWEAVLRLRSPEQLQSGLMLVVAVAGLVAMSAHAIVRESDRHQHVLEHVHDAMRLFGIDHVTVQLERREMYERESHLHE
jgi:cobalt-zinc-cadmium efflux system protein